MYSTPPSGLYQVGSDAQGNPVYSNQPAATASTAAAPAASTGTSFFSEDSLGLGLNNAWYIGIGLGAFLLFKKR